jgi:phosphate transport system permease protein
MAGGIADGPARYAHRCDARCGRASGETAPLLFTALFSNYWLIQDGQLGLMEPTASLAVLIYNFAGMPFENQIEMAWAAALVLVLLVLVINITGQLFSRRRV